MEKEMHGEGWRTQGAAEKYLQMVDVVAPGRKEILSVIARIATSMEPEQPRILDIGCGRGIVTDEILRYSPQASVVMMDYSEEMVSICNERFKDNPNIQVFHHDLNEGLGQCIEGRFDAVVSCFAIHHVDFENRVRLYKDINSVLKESGVFCNGDLFRGDSPLIHEWEFDNYICWMMDQLREKLGQQYTFEDLKAKQLENYELMKDKPGTVWDMCNDLKLAGFRFVDCLFKYQNLAVIAATNR